MITPYNDTIEDFIQALNSGKRQHARITYMLKSIEFTDDDITSNGIQISSYLGDDNTFRFGYSISKQITFSLIGSNKMSGLNLRNEFKVEFGYDDDLSVTHWALFGYFKSNDIKYDQLNNIYTIVANDRMQKFDVDAKPFIDSIDWDSPPTNSVLFDRLCSYINIEYVFTNNAQFVMYYYDKDAVKEIGDCRTLLNYFLESMLANGKINQDGKLEVFRVSTFVMFPLYPVYVDDQYCYSVDLVEIKRTPTNIEYIDLVDYTWSELNFTEYGELYDTNVDYYYRSFHAVYKDSLDISFPSSVPNNGEYLIANNPFVTVLNSTTVWMCYQVIGQMLLEYRSTLETMDVCALCESGDIVMYMKNVGGVITAIKIPIFACELTWNGSFTCRISSPNGLA